MKILLDEPSTSSSLLLRTQAGEQLAKKKLCEIYLPLVYAWSRLRFDLQDADAQDVSQSVAITILTKLHLFDRSKGPFRGWLWKVTQNAVVDYLRKERRQTELARIQAAKMSPPPEALQSEIPSIVARKALQVLQSRLQGVSLAMVIATCIEGRAPAAIAEEFGVGINAIYTARCRALKLLRESLAGLEFSVSSEDDGAI